MKTSKFLFWLTLIIGLVIVLIGVYLKKTEQSSEGFTAGRLGNVHQGFLTGFSCFFLGIVILIISFFSYRQYKDDKKKYENME